MAVVRSTSVWREPSDGVLLVAHHGTPSSGRPFAPYVEAAAERGLRLVTYSRPGYAGSTRVPGRSVADCAADTARIVDQLGGRPLLHDGAVGRRTARARVRGAAAGSRRSRARPPPASDRSTRTDSTSSTAWRRRTSTSWARRSRARRRWRRSWTNRPRTLRQATPADLAEALGGLVSPVDAAALTGEFAEHATAMLHESISTGIWGWFDDDVAFVHPWGFDLAQIRVPVTVWQGAQDRMVPFAHGEWLAANVAGAKARLFDDEGHLSLIVGSFPADPRRPDGRLGGVSMATETDRDVVRDRHGRWSSGCSPTRPRRSTRSTAAAWRTARRRSAGSAGRGQLVVAVVAAAPDLRPARRGRARLGHRRERVRRLPQRLRRHGDGSRAPEDRGGRAATAWRWERTSRSRPRTR